MYLRIERGSAVPVSRQIAEQIRAQCLSGTLSPGAALPSVRQLAQQLGVNVNTIFRVYEKLAADGLIEMRHGEGTFALPPAASKASRLSAQTAQYVRDFSAVVRQGLLLGLAPAELRKLLAATLAENTLPIREGKAPRRGASPETDNSSSRPLAKGSP